MATIQIDISVSNISMIIGLFDQIQVERSMDGEGGPYTEMTGAASAPATVLGTELSSFTLDGLTLQLRMDNGTLQEITFESADPISVDDTVDFINANIADGVTVEEAGAVRISSLSSGSGSVLEVVGGTALTELGLTAGTSYGVDDRIDLQAGVTDYVYIDHSGDTEFYYRNRYYNTLTEAVSSYSDPVPGGTITITPTSNLILGYLDLMTVSGEPIEGAVISIHPVFVPSAFLVGTLGVSPSQLRLVTDARGHAEKMLIRGSTLEVAIADTNIVRRIIVPSSGEDFNILGAIAEADDVYQISIISIPTAVRRS